MILPSNKKDGRHLRSVKTQNLIVDSTVFLFLKSNSAQWPTAEQVAKHSNIGLRTVFRHFDDMESLIESCHEKFMIMIEDYFQGLSRKIGIIVMTCVSYAAIVTAVFAIARIAL